MQFVATWINLEIITLSEVSERQTLHDITYMWHLKKKRMIVNLFIEQKQTHEL